MDQFAERSAYPHPRDFEVMRPEYEDLEDGQFRAIITVAPFRVRGTSATRPGARRAALYEAQKAYRSYHPSYRVQSPYPSEFVDDQAVKWVRVPEHERGSLGDYAFTDEEGTDYADIESMLMWDVRTPPTEE